MARIVLVLLVLAAIGWWLLRPGEIARPDGVLAPDAPAQELLSDGPQFQVGDYQLTALARFEVDARVLSAERYRRGRESDLSPIDLALGWGPMSSNEVLGRLSIKQYNRFYFYSWSDSRSLPVT